MEWQSYTPAPTMSDEALKRFAADNETESNRLLENEKQYGVAIAEKFFEDCTVAGFCAGVLFSMCVVFIVEWFV